MGGNESVSANAQALPMAAQAPCYIAACFLCWLAPWQARACEHGHNVLTSVQDQEQGHLQQLQSLMPGYRARPSVLGPVAAAAGFSLGAAAGLLPTKLSHAITGNSTRIQATNTLHVGPLLAEIYVAAAFSLGAAAVR